MADKTYTEEEFNSAMAGLRAKEESKYKKLLESAQEAAAKKALEKFREENSLDDETLAKLQNLDAKDVELRQMSKKLSEYETKVSELSGALQQKNKEFVMHKAKDNVIKNAIKYNAMNPSDVWDIMQSKVKVLDDGSYGLIDEKGEVSKKPIDEHVKSFLDDRPHFVRSDVPSGGSGSRPNNGSSSTPKDKDISIDSTEFRQSFEQRVKAALGE